ncbi:MAG TPA: TIGR02300 family protein [Rhodobacteraceae bacterium]|nr:TIGR02300 family protein [Paracoccaceae bacterium]
MPKEEWGVKRVCPETGKRFYDLNKDPVVSPYTGEVINIDTGNTRTMVADKEDASAKPKEELAADADDIVLDDDDTADVDLGDDVLDDDDDDAIPLEEIADVPAADDES